MATQPEPPVDAAAEMKGRVETVKDGLARVETAVGPLLVAADSLQEQVFVCVRPENVHLRTGEDHPVLSARNTLSGQVTRISKMESFLQVSIDCGVPITALLTRSAVEELEISEGTRVHAFFKATAAHLIPRTAK